MSVRLEIREHVADNQLVEAYYLPDGGTMRSVADLRFLRNRAALFAVAGDELFLQPRQHAAIEQYVNKSRQMDRDLRFKEIPRTPCRVALQTGSVYEAFENLRYAELIYPAFAVEGWKDLHIAEAYPAALALIRVKLLQ